MFMRGWTAGDLNIKSREAEEELMREMYHDDYAAAVSCYVVGPAYPD